MMRRLFSRRNLNLLVFFIVAAWGAWFLLTHHLVAHTYHRVSSLVYRQEYFAFERFFQAMGQPVHHIKSRQEFSRLSTNAVLILTHENITSLGLEQNENAEALGAWIKRGGQLWLANTHQSAVDFLKKFDISISVKDIRSIYDLTESCGYYELCKLSNVTIPNPQHQSDILFRVSIHKENAIFLEKGTWEWSIGPDKEHMWIGQVLYGQGRITIFNDLNLLAGNYPIWQKDDQKYLDKNTRGERPSYALQRADNAKFLWTLANLPNEQPRSLFFIDRLRPTHLGSWLIENAFWSSLSFVICLLLWMLYKLPRLGRLVNEYHQPRRSLHEHLHALGVSLSYYFGIKHWLLIMHRELWQLIHKRHPYLAKLPKDQQIQALSVMTKLPIASIELALFSLEQKSVNQTVNAQERKFFFRTIQLMQQIRQKL